jgi:eukaryotic-like serine/threonine-protein kinase
MVRLVSTGSEQYLDRLAQAVSDGDAVDWAVAESHAPLAERRLVRELRVVSEIANLHRTFREDRLERTTELASQRVWAHLTLQETIGTGAYGTVYRAWDPQLDREVALKLISELNQADHAKAVVDEGRLLARVRHRGVVTVYGAARADGYAGLWMELVEGRTLEEILQQQGRFSAREAALIGVEVCEALAAVHGAGLLHRDVKAQNVMRDRNGRIVLMDFGTGRARLLPDDTPVADLAGTPLYMAPELFRGERASVQSDVYSMGVLLYRLVSGSFPVVARSLAQVRDGHLQGHVRRLRDQRSDLPAPFVHIVERALSPDPAMRHESAGALELALTGLLATSIDVPHVTSRVARPRWLLAAAAGILALVMGLGGGWWLTTRSRQTAQEPAPIRFLVHPPAGHDFESFALSPDGRFVAFTAAGQLWVKAMDAVEPTRLAQTQGAHDPFWSPDGRFIAYFKQSSLWIVGIAGGESRAICPAWNAMGGSWGPDRTILFAADLGQAIYRVSTTGGERTAVRTQGRDGFDLRWPSFLPSGKGYIYSARTTEHGPRTIHAALLDGSRDRALVASESNAQVAAGRILFLRQGKLFAQAFDEGRLSTRGAPVQVAERVPSNLYNRADYANFSAATGGTRLLAFLGTRQVDRELRLVDERRSETKLAGPGEYRDLAISRQGSHVAFEQLDEVTGTRDIWVMHLDRRQSVRLTEDPHDDTAPTWSADGNTVYYASNREGRSGIYRRPADGTGAEELVLADGEHAVPFDVSPDDGLLVLTRSHQRRDIDLWTLRLDASRKLTPYRTSTWRENEPRFSPDGKWLAYSTTDTGDRHVYIERIDRPGPRWQISVTNGREPFWRRDGREIFYHGPDRTLMAVTVDTSRTVPSIGRPRPVVPLQFRGWDVRYHFGAMPDGRSFLMNVPIAGSTPAPMTFVMHW